MENTEKMKRFEALASGETSNWEKEAEARQAQSGWRTKAAAIALQVLRSLRSQGISQKALAGRLGVSPQYINKIVKGNENLSLETITKLESALGTSLMTIYVGEQRRVGKSIFPDVAVDYYRGDSTKPERVLDRFSHFSPHSNHVSA